MKNQRNAMFDIAKCLAMYLVVLGHLIADRTGDSAYFINLTHLPVLFFISGFFSASSVEKRSAGELLKRKSTALLIPYLIWSAISLMANVALSVLQGGFSLEGSLQEAIHIFVYARSVWFLIQLFITFVIFLGIYILLKRTKIENLIVPVFCAVWFLLSCLIPGDILAFHKFKWLFPFFLAGYLMGKSKQKLAEWVEKHHKITQLRWLSLLYPALVAFLVREDSFRQYTNFSYEGLNGIISVFLYYGISAIGVVFVMSISALLNKMRYGNVVAEIGTYSMDIYVIHMFLIKFIPIPVDVKALSPWVANLLLACVSLGIVLVIWLLSRYALRKFKLFRISIGTN